MNKYKCLIALAFLILSPSTRAHSNGAQLGPHVMPMQSETSDIAHISTTGLLTYYGGGVVSKMRVIQVLWGAGNYLPGVVNTTSPSVATFFAGVLNSPYMDWLVEYNTNIKGSNGAQGTNQDIGHGTFAGQYTITPSITSTTIADTTIQSELVAQIQAGHLPAPTFDAGGNSNTYYAVYFPHGDTITLGNSVSCVKFCSYHGTIMNVATGEFFYSAQPDFQPGTGCNTGCGASVSALDNVTSVSSHEMIETVTDGEVGIIHNFGPPLGWYNTTIGEIGDICTAQQGSVVGGDGVSYRVQKEYSNITGTCLVTRSNDDFVMAPLSPTGNVVVPGGSTSYIVSTSVKSGAAESVTLALVDAPFGVTASFLPNPVTAGASSTMTLSAAATAPIVSSAALVVTGVAPSSNHSSKGTINIATTVPDFSIGASPVAQSLARGHSGKYTISLLAVSGASGTVALSCSGAPARTTCSISPSQVVLNGANATSTATVTVGSKAALGTYKLTFTGQLGTMTHSTISSLTVK